MKKIFICLLISVCLLCCSCKKREVVPILRDVSFVADISFYNEFYSLDAEIDKDGNMTVDIIAPEDLSGLKILFEKDKVTAEYMGLTYTPKQENMPLCRAAGMLYEIIRSIETGAETASEEDGNCTVESRTEDTSYKFTFSPSGLPLTLEAENEGIKIEFKDVRLSPT